MNDFLCPHCALSYRAKRKPRADSRRFGSHVIEPCPECEKMGADVAICCSAIRARIRSGMRLPFTLLCGCVKSPEARNAIERDMSIFLPHLMIDWSKRDVVPIVPARPAT